jgi:hypothetical protein
VKTLLLAVTAFVFSTILGDVLFLWLVSNAVLAYPLGLKLKGKEIQGVLQLVDS